MGRICTCILLALVICCKPKTMNEREFTQLYVNYLSKSYPEARFEIAADLTIKGSYKGTEFSHYLDNAFREYKMEPDSVDEVINRYVASSGSLYKESEPIDLSQIVPIIKPIDFLQDVNQLSKENGAEKEPSLVYEAYNSQLIIVYAENTEVSIKYLTQEDFSKLSVHKDSLRSLAVKNLKAVLPEVQSRGANGAYMISVGGDFEASLILLTKMWTSDNFKVKGDLVIAIPIRDMLIITGSEEEHGLKTIKDITDDSFTNGNHQVSPYLFKWDGQKFEQWK